jgi:hypothetical protein
MHRARRWTSIAACLAILAGLVLASSGEASNGTLRTSLRSWSQTIGVDAHSVALAAQRQHPRRMVSSARRFRVDALKARTAIRAQRASTAAGRRAKRLAVSAFGDYAAAGRLWTASGQARLRGQKATASRYARSAAVRAKAGNRSLLKAGKLLP